MGDPFLDPQTAWHPEPAADVPARRVGAQEAGDGEEPDLVAGGQCSTRNQAWRLLPPESTVITRGANWASLADQPGLLALGQDALVELGDQEATAGDIVLTTDGGLALEIDRA
jgi:hypothetical protein